MTEAISKALEAERNLFKGKYRAMLRLVSRMRAHLVHVTDHIEDEGDRVYFGSTNDADALRDIYQELEAWEWDAIDKTNRMQADPYAMIREQRARAEAAEAECERLREALDDLVSWFPQAPRPASWEITAGEMGADDAIAHARAVLGAGHD